MRSENIRHSHQKANLTRRDVVQRGAGIGAGAVAAGLLPQGAGWHSALAKQEGEGVYGGTLRVGLLGEPPTLDEHQTTAGLVAEVTYPMYETLFTYDDGYQPIPELVEIHTVSDDGLVHTMKLREGITFHNGEPMTAADVHASVTRWAEISGVGQALFESVDEFVEVDDATVEFRLSQPYGTILIALAHNTQACTIHPKSIVEAAGTEPFTGR